MLAGVKSVVRFNLYWLEFVIKLTLQLYSLHLINLRQVQKLEASPLTKELLLGNITRSIYGISVK